MIEEISETEDINEKIFTIEPIVEQTPAISDKLEHVTVDKNMIKNNLDYKETYYIIYSETCMLCQILLKYVKYIQFKYKLIHINDLLNIDSTIQISGVPYVISSKKEKINISSLLEILKEHNIKTLKKD